MEMGNVNQVNYPYTQRGEGGESEGKEGAVREVQTGTQTDRQTEIVMVTRDLHVRDLFDFASSTNLPSLLQRGFFFIGRA